MSKLLVFVLALWASVGTAKTVQLVPANTVFLLGTIESRMVYDAMQHIADAEQRGAKRIDMVIDSYGGYVDAGLKLITQMQVLQSRGVRFACVVTGSAMSMAYYIFANCDYRYVLPSSQLLWHPIRISFEGALTGLEASNIGRTLIQYENSMKAKLIDQMQCGSDWFEAHWAAETQWHGDDLRTAVPKFLTVVSGVDGVPAKSLFHVPQSSFFGIDSTTDIHEPKLIW